MKAVAVAMERWNPGFGVLRAELAKLEDSLNEEGVAGSSKVKTGFECSSLGC